MGLIAIFGSYQPTIIALMEPQNQFVSLHKDYYKVMIIKRMVFFLVLFIVLVTLFFLGRFDAVSNVWLGLSGSLIVVFFALVFMLARVFFKRKKYRLFDKNLTYQEGVLVHKETVVPFSRIQHVEIDEGPLERYFSLATLSIYTAGDSGKDLRINGLNIEVAQETKDFITNYIKDE